jgi:hypothetical protein
MPLISPILSGGRDVQTGQATFLVEAAQEAMPSWSTDGGRIYYIVRRPFVAERFVRKRDPRTGVDRDLLRNPLVRNFEMSPDGRFLAAWTASIQRHTRLRC